MIRRPQQHRHRRPQRRRQSHLINELSLELHTLHRLLRLRDEQRALADSAADTRIALMRQWCHEQLEAMLLDVVTTGAGPDAAALLRAAGPVATLETSSDALMLHLTSLHSRIDELEIQARRCLDERRFADAAALQRAVDAHSDSNHNNSNSNGNSNNDDDSDDVDDRDDDHNNNDNVAAAPLSTVAMSTNAVDGASSDGIAVPAVNVDKSNGAVVDSGKRAEAQEASHTATSSTSTGRSANANGVAAAAVNGAKSGALASSKNGVDEDDSIDDERDSNSGDDDDDASSISTVLGQQQPQQQQQLHVQSFGGGNDVFQMSMAAREEELLNVRLEAEARMRSHFRAQFEAIKRDTLKIVASFANGLKMRNRELQAQIESVAVKQADDAHHVAYQKSVMIQVEQRLQFLQQSLEVQRNDMLSSRAYAAILQEQQQQNPQQQQQQPPQAQQGVVAVQSQTSAASSSSRQH